jgi:CHAD domain-containing protein
MAHPHTYTYSLLAEESVAEATTRIAREQLVDAAIGQLTERLPSDPEKAIHNARKAIKRERSLVRLIRGAMPVEQRRHEHAALRDAAQLLSGARDADAMAATVDALSKRFAGQLPERAFTAIRAALEADHDRDEVCLLAARASAVAAELDALRERTMGWEIASDGWRALDAGLLRSYRRGRRAFARAHRGRSTAALHDWRKRVKDLWYQSRLLAYVCGPAIAGQAKDAHALATCSETSTTSRFSIRRSPAGCRHPLTSTASAP